MHRVDVREKSSRKTAENGFIGRAVPSAIGGILKVLGRDIKRYCERVEYWKG